jgi:hypothetical protein
MIWVILKIATSLIIWVLDLISKIVKIRDSNYEIENKGTKIHKFTK